MRHPLALLAGAVLLAGCSDIIPPPRENAYEHRIFVGGTGLGFRWSQEEMPLKIWVAEDSPLRPHVLTAIDRWSKALLYGELRAQLVETAAEADIVIRNTLPDVVDPGDAGEPVALHAVSPQCSGETQLDIDVAAKTLRLPILVYVWVNGSPSAEALTTCYRLTTTHELGHALGIMEHSISTADVMYRDPVLDGLSAADRETMEIVFHSLPTLTIVRDGAPALKAARIPAIRMPF